MQSVQDYIIDIKNSCPSQIWYRFYAGDQMAMRDVVPSNKNISLRTPNKLTNVKGMSWQAGESEDWKPSFDGKLDEESTHHRLTITPVFGPRTACLIKVIIASLAGPADPSVRNDIILAHKFEEHEVPTQNIHLLLEKQ